jgi:hypothetical protein
MTSDALRPGVWTIARRAALLALVAAPIWAQAQSALGDVDAMADVFQGPTPSPVTANDEQVRPSGVSVLAIAQTAHEQRKAHGFAQVNADPAGAGSGTFALARGDASVGATAEATARWAFSDGLTIDRADLTGRTGVVTVAIRYGGLATADAVGDNTAWSSASLVARFGGDSAEASTSASVRDGIRTEDPLTDVPGATRGEFLLTTAFTWGEAIDLSLDSFTSVASYTAGQAESYATAGVSGFWDRIRSVTVDDVAVRDYQLSSLSGYDYRYPFGELPPPVPEPGMAAAMALGIVLAGLGVRCRRRPREGTGA